MKKFYLYILKCVDSSYYVGHTDDLERRLEQHSDATYERYTTTRLLVELVY